MAKDPAFLFYPNDWIGGTLGMTFEEKGAYMELLMTQFNRGHMSGHMIGQVVGQIWSKVQDKFIKDENGLCYNQRLEEEKLKRQNFTKTRHNNLSGKNQYTKNNKKNKEKEAGHIEAHMTNHMEDENTLLLNNTKDNSVIKNSNLNRQPIIPNKDEVWEVFQRSGGTKEMAKSFYEKYESVGWITNTGAITNFVPLANRFISTWKMIEDDKKKKNEPTDPTKVKIILK